MLKLADTVTDVTGISDFRLHSLPKSASGFGSRPSGNGTSSIGNLLEFWVYVSVSVVRNKASRYNAVAPAATGLRLGPARLIRAEQTEFIWARAARAVLIRSFSVRRALQEQFRPSFPPGPTSSSAQESRSRPGAANFDRLRALSLEGWTRSAVEG